MEKYRGEPHQRQGEGGKCRDELLPNSVLSRSELCECSKQWLGKGGYRPFPEKSRRIGRLSLRMTARRATNFLGRVSEFLITASKPQLPAKKTIMRLTLRTLLAYRDGVLSPADTEDLHRRIQSSHDAGNLLRRIGAVTKLNQVLAPALLGKGLGGDANSIAEYLDDSLQHSQIPELERICLTSDMQLAELADCHTLLSTAMNTKVPAPADLRRMVLAVADPPGRREVVAELEARKAPRRKRRDPGNIVRADAAHATPRSAEVASVPVEVTSPMVASGGESIKPQGLNLETSALAHEVPEYLVGSSASNWKIPLAIGVLAGLLGVLVWQTLGPWKNVAELFAVAPDSTKNKSSSTDSIDYDLIVESEQTPPGVSPAKNELDVGTNDVGTNSASKSTPNSITDAVAIEADVAAPPTVAATIDVDSATPPGLDSSSDKQTPPKPSTASPSVAQPTVTSEAPPGISADVSKDAPSTSAPTPTKKAANGTALWLPHDDKASEAVILSRSGNVLLRVKAGEALQTPLELLVPPFTRTTIDLPGGALWTACGPSLLKLDQEDQAGTADVAKPNNSSVVTGLCRALVRGGPDGRHVVVATPVGRYLLELTDPDSLLSVEMSYRPATAGSTIDSAATKPVLVFIAAEGQATVTPLDPIGEPQKLKLGDGLGIVAGSKANRFRLQTIPNWFGTSVERPIDSLAAQDLHQLLSANVDPKASLAASLLELSRSRRPETAALATQLLMLAGEWEPLVDGFLNNERFRSHWNPTLTLTRQLLAHSGPSADKLRQLLLDKHAADGEMLYDLIRGQSAEELGNDGLAKLIGRLESPRLDVRVVAAFQLELLTGKNLGYQPTSTNRASVQQWRRDLSTNRVTLLEPIPLIFESVPR